MTANDMVMGIVAQHFRPEFVNRIDDVVVFRALDTSAIRRIAALQLALLNRRLAEQGLSLNLTSAAMNAICEAGYDPVYGAGPSSAHGSACRKSIGGGYARRWLRRR